jgi:hypothetical protein
MEIRRRLQQSYLTGTSSNEDLQSSLTPNHTSIEALGSHYPKQRQHMVVADIILSHTLKHTKQFMDRPSQKELVQQKFSQSEFLAEALNREQKKKKKFANTVMGSHNTKFFDNHSKSVEAL